MTLQANGHGPQPGEALRCGIYYRVSDPKQESDGFGFAYQERNLPRNAEAFGWRVVAHYKEPGISADQLHTRPQLLRALADAEGGAFDVLLAVEDTRFSRGELGDWQVIKNTCDRSGVALATPSGIFYRPGNPDDDFMTDIRGAMSKREKKSLQFRMARGRLEGMEKGFLFQRIARYGYEWERFTVNGRVKGSYKRLVIREHQAEVVRLIYRLSAYGDVQAPGGWGAQRIMRYLNEVAKVPGPAGGLWNTFRIRDIIRTTTYKGELVYDRDASWLDGYGLPKRVTQADPNVVPAIVTPELWQAANDGIQYRADYGRGRPPQKYPRALLASLLRCKACGYKFFHRHRKGKCQRYICYTRHNPYMVGVERCAARHWRAEDVESAVWSVLAGYIQSPDLLRAAIDESREEQPEASPAERAGLEKALAANDRERERVIGFAREGIITPADLKRELEKVTAAREGLETRLALLQAGVEARAQWETYVAGIADQVADYREMLMAPDLAPEHKRRVLDDLVREVSLDLEGEFEILTHLGKRTLRGRAKGKMECPS